MPRVHACGRLAGLATMRHTAQHTEHLQTRNQFAPDGFGRPSVPTRD
jgi:hypothetical protein